MKLDKLNPNVIRNTNKVSRISVLSDVEMKRTVGGAAGFGCFPCPGHGCFIYIDTDCLGEPDRSIDAN